MEITAVNNNLVKETAKLQQRKYRDNTGKFLLEGFKAIDEAFRAGIDIETVFVLKEKAGNYGFLKDKIILTNEAVLKKISTTDTAPEAVGIAFQRHYGIKDIKGLSTTAIFYELFFITYWYRLQMQMQLAGKIETVDLIFTVIWLIGSIGSIALHEIEKSR